MLRTAFLLGFLVLPAAAVAAPTPEPQEPHDGGMVDAHVTAVDFRASTIVVAAPNHNRLTVEVMPSTSIQGPDPAYRTITDLKPGQHVQVYTSVTGDRYVAQIIRILP